jgi:uncharacterized membrane protein
MDRSQADVVVIAVVAALAGAVAAVGAPAAVTAVLGLALFAAPGYVLSRLLTGHRIGGLERVVVATGLALIVPVLGGLLLYGSGVPLHRAGWLGLLIAVTLAGDVVLYVRRRIGRVPPFNWNTERWRIPPLRLATFAAAVLVAAGALTLARISVAIQPHPGFTQLSLSSQHQKVHTMLLGVSNDEGSTTSYRLVLLRNHHVSATWNLTLADGQTWQRSMPFTGKYTLTANLYRLPDLTHPYRYVTTPASKAVGA